MKKALILLAEGFEQSEALVTHDILLRSKQIDVKLASISKELVVAASSGLQVKADVLLTNVNLDEIDFIVLPGGMPGVKNLFASFFVTEAIKQMKEKGKHVHAICAAPFILGNLGYLDELSYTCFPSFQAGKGIYTGDGVTLDKDTITGKAMGYSTEFGLKIVELEVGELAASGVKASILGE